jgi:tetratricopeptide (TPR) repeat protein
MTDPEPPASDADLFDQELARIGLAKDLIVLRLKAEVQSIVNFVPECMLVPMAYLPAALTGGITVEIAALAFREAIESLRPHGATVVLAETLLAASRAQRKSFPIEAGFAESLSSRIALVLEAIEVLERLQNRARQGRALLELGVVLKDGGDLYDALSALDRAMATCREANDRGGLSAILYHRANICRRLKQPIEALDALREAEELLPEYQASWRSQIRSERIFCELARGRDDRALVTIEEWLASEQGHYFPWFYRGEIRERAGDAISAFDDFCRASAHAAHSIHVQKTELFRREERARTGFVFASAIRLGLAGGRVSQAIGIIELANTGALALAGRRADAETIARETIDRLTAETRSLSTSAASALHRGDASEIRKLGQSAEWLVAELELARTGWNTDVSVDNLTTAVGTIADSIRSQLPVGTLLIEPVFSGDYVWLVAMTREEVLAERCDLRVSDVAVLEVSFGHECRGRLDVMTLDELGRALLGPIDQLLEHNTSLVVAGTIAVRGAPFHALTWRGQPLIDTHVVRYVSAATDLRTSERIALAPGWSCDVVAAPTVPYRVVPELHGVRREIDRLRQILGDRVREQTVDTDRLFETTTARVVHFACHGVYHAEEPLLSHLLLHDRPLFAFELTNRRLAADVVVMTACHAAASEAAAGGHVQSIAAAVLRSGVGTVVGALWEVDDAAGAVFADLFYRQLDRSPDAVAAVRAAQRALRADPRFAHPFYWAPFISFSRGGE